MSKNTKILSVVVLALFVFLVFVPVIRLDANVRPWCVIDRVPCPLTISVPIGNHEVYWSITAYYLGWGTYLVAFTLYGGFL